MLISHRYKFIYLKTVKTAGTSVETALEHLCLPDGHPGIPLITPAVETGAGVIGARGDHARGADWRNHMPASGIRDKLSPDVWDSYFRFCNIRNPWDKTVSWFHFVNPSLGAGDAAAIIAAFRAWLDRRTPIGQDYPIYAIAGEPVVNDVIRYETMARDLARICRTLGMPCPEIPREKTASRVQKIPYRKYFDARTRTIVADKYAPEIERFGWEF